MELCGFPEDGVVASESDPRRWRKYSRAVAEAVIAQTRAGKVLRQVCAEPGMPPVRVVVRWTTERPEFGAAMREARERAGLLLRGGTRSTFCEETGEAICARLCQGETMVAILREPDMPGYSTFYRWVKTVPAFREAVGLAREIQGQRLAELGWEEAAAVTPETAFAVKVRLEHLRWYASKLSPRRYGPQKPVEPGAGAPPALHVYTKRFLLPTREEEAAGVPGRWSSEPAEHLYSMAPVGKHPRAGEPLPPPAVVREPASTQGPDARGEGRGGAVEAEYDAAEESWEDKPDDYWL